VKAAAGTSDSRPVLLTGANGLLISSVATRLQEFFPLLLHVHRRRDRLEAAGLDHHPVVEADLSSEHGVATLAAAAERVAPLGGIVLGASAFQKTHPVTAQPHEIRNVLALELVAHLELIHRLHSSVHHGGRIVLFSDAGIPRGWPSYDGYLAAKAGLEAATRSLARALGPRIIIFCVSPGLSRGAATPPQGTTLEHVALGRAADPEEIATFVVRAWDLPPAVTHGHVLHVDGGWSCST
jgi:pteridine reductase